MTLTSAEVRAVRIKLNLSTEKLGHLLGVSGRTVRNWENGMTQPQHRYAAMMVQLSEGLFDRFYETGPNRDRLTMVFIVSPGFEGVYQL